VNNSARNAKEPDLVSLQLYHQRVTSSTRVYACKDLCSRSRCCRGSTGKERTLKERGRYGLEEGAAALLEAIRALLVAGDLVVSDLWRLLTKLSK
jgi:hypothetical protein